MILRVFGASVGPGAYIYPSVRIWAPWRLTLAEESCLGPGVDCYNVDLVQLGPGSIVSQRAFLCTASHDFDELGFPLVAGRIMISSQAWVAAEAFIGPGVTLHPGAVVLARAVVTRDVAEWTVVGGNPARAIRSRRRSSSITRGER